MYRLVCILLFLLTVINNRAQDNITSPQLNGGFANKDEAKNEFVNGVKQGKWIEYLDYYYNEAASEALANYYRLVIYEDGNYNETCREYEINDKLIVEIPYHKGKGEAKYFYNNGNLKMHYYLINGKINGLMKIYSEDGKLLNESNYINGVQYGLYKLYNSEGKEINSEFKKGDTIIKQQAKVTKTEGDKKNGVTKTFYDSGELNSEANYVDGKIEGIEKTYYLDGKLREEILYSNGLKNGVAKIYNGVGGIYKEMPYQNGKIHGISKGYYSNGKISSETNYSNGRLHGIKKIYHKNGNTYSEETYDNGRIVGISKTYSDEGFIANETSYSNTEMKLRKTYHPSGKLQSETPYKNGKMEGLQKNYNEDGTLSTEIYFVNGKIEGLERIYLNIAEKNRLYREMLWSNSKTIEAKTFNADGTFSVMSYKDGNPDGVIKNYSSIGRLTDYSVNENGENKFIKANGEELYKNNSGSILKGVLQVFQQAAAYQAYQQNPSAENFSKYTNVIANNFSKSPEEAIKANNEVLTEPVNVTVESTAITNSNTSNAQQAALCAKRSAKEWEASIANKMYLKNQLCNKMAYISQREQAIILLKNCKQYYSPADIVVLNKTISALTDQIDSMPDCQIIIFDAGKKQPTNITTVPNTTPKSNNNNGGRAVKAK